MGTISSKATHWAVRIFASRDKSYTEWSSQEFPKSLIFENLLLSNIDPGNHIDLSRFSIF